jgi:hypothetical protein
MTGSKSTTLIFTNTYCKKVISKKCNTSNQNRKFLIFSIDRFRTPIAPQKLDATVSIQQKVHTDSIRRKRRYTYKDHCSIQNDDTVFIGIKTKRMDRNLELLLRKYSSARWRARDVYSMYVVSSSDWLIC